MGIKKLFSKYGIWIVLIVLLSSKSQAQKTPALSKQTILVGYIHAKNTPDSVNIFWDGEENKPDWHDWKIQVPIINGRFFVRTDLSKPAQFSIGNSLRNHYFLEPGDSLRVDIYDTVKWDSLVFSGTGALRCQIVQQARELKSPNEFKGHPNIFVCESLDDFFNTNNYFLETQKLQLAYLDRYKEQLSSTAYARLQIVLAGPLEHYRLGKVRSLFKNYKKFNLTDKDLEVIYDTTIEKSVIDEIPIRDDFSNSLSFISYVVFNYLPVVVAWEMRKNPNLSSEENYHRQIQLASQKYSGLLRERLISRIFRYYIKNVPIHSTVLREDVYTYVTTTGYNNYGQFVDSLFESANSFVKGSTAPNFTLNDRNNKAVSLRQFAGKVVLIDFWFTGCHPCAGLVPTLKQISEAFRGDTSVVFVNISIDEKKTWLNSLSKGKYSTGEGVCLYTNDQGKSHDIIRDYHVSGYPRLVLVNKYGKIVSISPPDPRPQGDGREMIRLIRQQLQE